MQSDRIPGEPARRPPLERWFERTFGDDAPTHLGSGWLSGTVSVFLGACGLGAVANVGIASYLFASDTQWVVAALAGIAVGAVWNYAITQLYTWGQDRSRDRR